MNQILQYFVLSLFVISCARAPLQNRTDSLRLVEDVEDHQELVTLEDDLEIGPLINGIAKQVAHLGKHRAEFLDFTFADRKLSIDEYLLGLQFILHSYKVNPSKKFVIDQIREHFDFYEVYGREDYGRTFITSYYEPVFKGSRKRTEKFSHALYKNPGDIVEIDIQGFIHEDYGIELKEDTKPPRRVKGRLLKKKSVRGNYQVAPAFSRDEIDNQQALAGRGLELCYVDPVEAFFLQVQGSGAISFPSGREMRVGYANQNGRKYVSIGKHLTDIIPKEEMSLQRIEKHLRSLPREEMLKVLNVNPSYVFFRKLKNRPVTTSGTEVIDGRTVATDVRYFPKGALAFLVYPRPQFDQDSGEFKEFKDSSRFVLDQDTGGAIKGGGRLDLFWGRGDQAKRYAGVLKGYGRLYYLAPKRELLNKLRDAKN